MSGNSPVETKPAAPAVAASALTEPTAASAAKAKQWMIGHKQKYWLLAGVAGGLALAGGVYGYKYFTATPGRVIAQTEAPASPPAKAEEPPKTDELPPVEVPPVLPVTNDPPVPAVVIADIVLPNGEGRVKSAATTGGIFTKEWLRAAALAGGGIKTDTSSAPLPDALRTEGGSLLILPPPMPGDSKTTPNGDKTDPFKATGPVLGVDKPTIEAPPIPAGLPTEVRERKDNDPNNGTPIIRIGGMEPPPPVKKDETIVPPPPPIPDVTGIKKEDSPIPPTIPVISPIVVPESKRDNPPIPDVPPIAPPPAVSPMLKGSTDPKSPAITPPEIKITDPTGPAPTISPTGIGDPPVPPLIPGPKVAEKKKDMYDEDWHSHRDGDTYPLISREYYHTADYAAALEAYNKDRRKSKDDVIRVPPPWVLKEQFPNLINEPAEKSSVPAPSTTGSIKFEPVTPAPGTRPAPVSASRSNDEYRVTNPAGETIREIARKLYGNENAWKKVFDKNPDIDPTQPIPSGTTLRVAK